MKLGEQLKLEKKAALRRYEDDDYDTDLIANIYEVCLDESISLTDYISAEYFAREIIFEKKNFMIIDGYKKTRLIIVPILSNENKYIISYDLFQRVFKYDNEIWLSMYSKAPRINQNELKILYPHVDEIQSLD